jgi:hypothetical protein
MYGMGVRIALATPYVEADMLDRPGVGFDAKR